MNPNDEAAGDYGQSYRHRPFLFSHGYPPDIRESAGTLFLGAIEFTQSTIVRSPVP
jgi:hypothetical protein